MCSWICLTDFRTSVKGCAASKKSNGRGLMETDHKTPLEENKYKSFWIDHVGRCLIRDALTGLYKARRKRSQQNREELFAIQALRKLFGAHVNPWKDHPTWDPNRTERD